MCFKPSIGTRNVERASGSSFEALLTQLSSACCVILSHMRLVSGAYGESSSAVPLCHVFPSVSRCRRHRWRASRQAPPASRKSALVRITARAGPELRRSRIRSGVARSRAQPREVRISGRSPPRAGSNYRPARPLFANLAPRAFPDPRRSGALCCRGWLGAGGGRAGVRARSACVAVGGADRWSEPHRGGSGRRGEGGEGVPRECAEHTA
jgi:hypothetical protein